MSILELMGSYWQISGKTVVEASLYFKDVSGSIWGNKWKRTQGVARTQSKIVLPSSHSPANKLQQVPRLGHALPRSIHQALLVKGGPKGISKWEQSRIRHI